MSERALDGRERARVTISEGLDRSPDSLLAYDNDTDKRTTDLLDDDAGSLDAAIEPPVTKLRPGPVAGLPVHEFAR